MMANKYRQGAPFQTVQEAVTEILQDRYVWWHGKPMHPKWMESLQLRVIREAVAKRMIFIAVENQHEPLCELEGNVGTLLNDENDRSIFDDVDE